MAGELIGAVEIARLGHEQVVDDLRIGEGPAIGRARPALLAVAKRRSPGLTDASLTLEDLRAVVVAVEPHGRHVEPPS